MKVLKMKKNLVLLSLLSFSISQISALQDSDAERAIKKHNCNSYYVDRRNETLINGRSTNNSIHDPANVITIFAKEKLSPTGDSTVINESSITIQKTATTPSIKMTIKTNKGRTCLYRAERSYNEETYNKKTFDPVGNYFRAFIACAQQEEATMKAAQK